MLRICSINIIFKNLDCFVPRNDEEKALQRSLVSKLYKCLYNFNLMINDSIVQVLRRNRDAIVVAADHQKIIIIVKSIFTMAANLSKSYGSMRGMRCSSINKSTKTIAVTASSTTGTRNAMHKSCLPFTEKLSI